MKFYIFGNGFDISHGLKTSFTDFKKYVEFANPNNYSCLNEFEYDTSDLWGDFENTIAKLDMDDFMAFVGSIYDEKDVLEEEKEETIISNKLDFEHLLINHNECREDIKKWLNGIPLPNKKFELKKTDLYFTFNYTLLLEKVYGIPQSNVLHIHGDLDNSDLIIGYDNYDLDDAIEAVSPVPNKQFPYEFDGYCIMAKYFYSFHKNTKDILTKNINFISKAKNVDEIVIYGVSFSKCDETYLGTILKTVNDRIPVKIYYYSDNDYKKINNFIKKHSNKFNLFKIENGECIVEI